MSIITFDGSVLSVNGSPQPVTFVLYVSPNSGDNGLTLVSGASVPQGWRIAQGRSLTGQIHGTFDSADAQRIRLQVQLNTAKSVVPLRSIMVYRDAVRPTDVATLSTAPGAFPYWMLCALDDSSYMTVPMSGDLSQPAWALGNLRWSSQNPDTSGFVRAFKTVANQAAAQTLAGSNPLSPTGAAANTSSAIAGKPSTSGTSAGVGGTKY